MSSNETPRHDAADNARSLTTQEWEETIFFLTATGQKCTPLRQEFILLSDVLGVSALVDAINNPPVHGGTESSVLGPFYTDDSPDRECVPFISHAEKLTACATAVQNGDSIASEDKGDYMYVEGRVLSTDGTPVPNATIETWETDGHGGYLAASHCVFVFSADGACAKVSTIRSMLSVTSRIAEGACTQTRTGTLATVLWFPSRIRSRETYVAASQLTRCIN